MNVVYGTKILQTHNILLTQLRMFTTTTLTAVCIRPKLYSTLNSEENVISSIFGINSILKDPFPLTSSYN